MVTKELHEKAGEIEKEIDSIIVIALVIEDGLKQMYEYSN